MNECTSIESTNKNLHSQNSLEVLGTEMINETETNKQTNKQKHIKHLEENKNKNNKK